MRAGRLNNRINFWKAMLLVLLSCSWSATYAQPVGCQEGGCARFSYQLGSVDSQRSVLLNALVGNLLGGNVSLSVVNWNNLVQANVNLVDFLDALQLETNVGSTDQVLSTDVTLLQIIDAATTVLQADGNTTAVNALTDLRQQINILSVLQPIHLGDLLNIETNEGAISDININTLDLLYGSISLFNYDHVLSTPTPVTISAASVGLGSVANGIELYAQVSEPPVYSCGASGTSFYSAGVRIKLNIDLVDVSLTQLLLDLGLDVPPGIANLDVSLGQAEIYLDVARAAGVIQTVNAVAHSLTLQADPAVADLYLGHISDNVFFSHSSILDPDTDLDYTTVGNLDITLLGAASPISVMAGIDARAYAAANAPGSNTLIFNGPYPESQTVGNSSTFISNLLSTLFQNLDVRIQASGLGGILQPLLNTLVNNVLEVLPAALDQTLTPILSAVLSEVVDPLLQTLGIQLGEAEVTVSGVGELCYGSISGYVYDDTNHNAYRQPAENGIEEPLFAKLISALDPSEAQIVVPVDQTSGSYSYPPVIAGTYSVVIDNNNSINDVTSSKPSEWIGTENSGQIRDSITIKDRNIPGINFGFFHGSKLTGLVFEDDGVGGGTANDGSQNGSEMGIAKSEVRLTNSSGNTIHGKTQTAGDGSYTLWIPTALSGNSLQIVETNYDHYVSTGGDGGTTGGTYNRSADAVGLVPISGTIYSDITFGDVPDNTFTTDGKQNGTAGNVLFFSHTFVAQTEGEVGFSNTHTANPDVSGWSQAVYRDNNCNSEIDDGEQLLSSPAPVTKGQKVCIVVRAYIPAGAPVGASNTMAITAGFNYLNASPALSRDYTRTDLVHVTDDSGSGLKIIKKVNQAAALPGETLIYTITYTNNSSKPLNDLQIIDNTPSYTGFKSASCNTPLSDNLNNCIVESPAVNDTGAITWTFSGTLVPGASGTVTYEVIIQD